MNAPRPPLRRGGEAGEGTAMEAGWAAPLEWKGIVLANIWALATCSTESFETAGETVKTEFPKMGQQDIVFLRIRGVWLGRVTGGAVLPGIGLGLYAHSGPAQHPSLGRCEHVGLRMQPNTLLLPSTSLPPSSPPFYSLGSQLTQQRAAEPRVRV